MNRSALALVLVLAACAPEDAAPEDAAPEDAKTATARSRATITNGELSTGDPSVVALVVVPLECGATERRTFCTGTLVAPRVVLTAAHCLESASPSGMKVYVGADVDRAAGALLAVRAFRSHPGWDGRRNDIAALLLEADAPMAPVTIDARYVPTAGDGVRVAGFGLDDVGHLGAKRSGAARVTTLEDLVFRIEAAPAMTCTGDSGGPVFHARDGVDELVGITSYGDSDCRIGINTRVGAFGGFVDGVLAEAAMLPRGPRRAIDPELDGCERSCATDADCPREMQCTRRSSGALRCALAGLAPGAFLQGCNAIEGCQKERCLSLSAANTPGAAGECRCYHECDPAEDGEPQPLVSARGGGCGYAPGGAASGLAIVLLTAAFGRRRSSSLSEPSFRN